MALWCPVKARCVFQASARAGPKHKLHFFNMGHCWSLYAAISAFQSKFFDSSHTCAVQVQPRIGAPLPTIFSVPGSPPPRNFHLLPPKANTAESFYLSSVKGYANLQVSLGEKLKKCAFHRCGALLGLHALHCQLAFFAHRCLQVLSSVFYTALIIVVCRRVVQYVFIGSLNLWFNLKHRWSVDTTFEILI